MSIGKALGASNVHTLVTARVPADPNLSKAHILNTGVLGVEESHQRILCIAEMCAIKSCE